MRRKKSAAAIIAAGKTFRSRTFSTPTPGYNIYLIRRGFKPRETSDPLARLLVLWLQLDVEHLVLAGADSDDTRILIRFVSLRYGRGL